MNSSRSKKFHVTRKSDGKTIWVNENFYHKVQMNRALTEISVDNIEDDITDKVIYRAAK